MGCEPRVDLPPGMRRGDTLRPDQAMHQHLSGTNARAHVTVFVQLQYTTAAARVMASPPCVLTDRAHTNRCTCVRLAPHI